MLAQSYFAERIHTQAYRYFFKSRNPEMVCKCIAEVSKEGYPVEIDLFYARACIDMLLRSTDCKKTLVILEEGRKVAGSAPLFNFVEFLIEALKAQNFEMAKTMTLTDYA